jgi:RNA polymerase sigma factor (sigma-70 family)
MNRRWNDFEALQRFARQSDHAAFAELAQRHIDLVYATAFRKVGDESAAEEVAQTVFATLAAKAWRFAPDDSVPAWLYRATLLEASQWLRSECRRRRREQIAAELGSLMKTPDEQSALRALLPLLDEALLSLREKDRAVLLLRFFEGRSLRDLGASLGLSEDAAQKRVATALQNLAQFFQRRGFRTASIVVTAAALEHTTTAAPQAVMAAVVHSVSQLSPPLLGGMTAVFAHVIALTKFQKTALLMLLLAVPALWQWRETRASAREAALNQAASESAKAQTQSVQASLKAQDRVEKAAKRLEQASARIASTTPQDNEYTVRIVGLVNLPDFKSALIEIHHRSLDRSNAQPFLVRRVLKEGQTLEDPSVKGVNVEIELLRVDSDYGNVLVRENHQERIYELEFPDSANLRSGGPLPPVTLPGLDFNFVLDLYGELIDRTILCHPAIKRSPVVITAAAQNKAWAAKTLERELNGRGAIVVIETDTFALLIPPDQAKATLRKPARKTGPSAENLPRGSIYLENVSLTQALVLYGELTNRKLIQTKPIPPGTLSFRNQTPLSKLEVIYAFDTLLGWQGPQITLIGERYFKITR